MTTQDARDARQRACRDLPRALPKRRTCRGYRRGWHDRLRCERFMRRGVVARFSTQKLLWISMASRILCQRPGQQARIGLFRAVDCGCRNAGSRGMPRAAASHQAVIGAEVNRERTGPWWQALTETSAAATLWKSAGVIHMTTKDKEPSMTDSPRPCQERVTQPNEQDMLQDTGREGARSRPCPLTPSLAPACPMHSRRARPLRRTGRGR